MPADLYGLQCLAPIFCRSSTNGRVYSLFDFRQANNHGFEVLFVIVHELTRVSVHTLFSCYSGDAHVNYLLPPDYAIERTVGGLA